NDARPPVRLMLLALPKRLRIAAPSRGRRGVFAVVLVLLLAVFADPALAQPNPIPQPPIPLRQPEPNPLGALPNVDQMLSPQGISSTLKLFIVLTVLSLAPSIFIMTTCFVRFIVVFG